MRYIPKFFLNLPPAFNNCLPQPIRSWAKQILNEYGKWNWERQSLPAMAKGDITILKGLLSLAGDKQLRILEWGSGASTVYYSKFLISAKRDFHWLAIESNQTWYEKTIRRIRKNQLTERVQVELYEFPDPREAWHQNRVHEALLNKDLQKYIYSPKDHGLQFDVIIVDGRLRRRCLLACLDILAPNGIVFLHDAHRPQYQSALESYRHIRFLLTGHSKLPQVVLCGVNSASLIEKIMDDYGGIAATGEWCDDHLFSHAHVSPTKTIIANDE